ncbi:MAG: hypothetical protein Q8Q94_02685 [bacterium]|nr:hypothetical protein [bacterium]MDZ4299672.1 hypothetical protein [Candidatus Sungbacteria bacterium]
MEEKITSPQWIEKPENKVSTLLALFSLFSVFISAYSAYVAVQSLSQAHDFFLIAQRPYIVIETIRIAELPNQDRPLAAEILVKNAGTTPALDMQFSGHLDIISTPPTTIQSDFMAQNGKIMLGSNSERAMRVTDGRALNTEELQQVQSEQLKVYVTGTVRYKDIFQNTHETQFCSFFNPKEKFNPLYLFACSELNVVQQG